MSVHARLRAIFEGVFQRHRMESNMEDELRFHRELYAADLVRTGTPPRDAELQARREFGADRTAERRMPPGTRPSPAG